MPSSMPSTLIIECPHCGTRYQVAMDALGPNGRQVQCAHCSQAWQAETEAGILPPEAVEAADTDTMFNEAEERELDAAFAEVAEQVEAAAAAAEPSVEDIKAAIAPKPKSTQPRLSSARKKKLQRALRRRQQALTKQLPLARVRRAVRVISLTALGLLIVGGIAFRTDIVRAFPDLAGGYAAIGLGVNVVGLEFRDVTTLVALRKGDPVMQVDARIYSVAAHVLSVPPVVVSLLNDEGISLYEWSVTPDASDIEPGEVVDFSTQLNAPPAEATRVKLTFGKRGTHSATREPKS